ncbi:MAG: metallophosphoesterase family protein, partial [Archaeoglobaceae archaeon]
LESLEFVLTHSEEDYMIFLGDYGDRGKDSPQVFCTLLRLKRDRPHQFILLRGNHEPPPDLPVSPHNLPRLLEEKFENGREIYRELSELFQYLPYAAAVRGSYLFLHGGLPDVSSLEEVEMAQENHPKRPHLEQILWSDPMEGSGTGPSLRGAGRMFGKDVTQQVLDSLGVKTLIRSHEPCEGVRVDHDGKVVTVFSNKIYGNLKAAFLVVDLSRAENGYELEERAIKF